MAPMRWTPQWLEAMRCQALVEASDYENSESETAFSTEASEVPTKSSSIRELSAGVQDYEKLGALRSQWRVSSSASRMKQVRSRTDSSMFRLRTRTDSQLALQFAEGEDSEEESTAGNRDVEVGSQAPGHKPCTLDPQRHKFPALLLASLLAGALFVFYVQRVQLLKLLGNFGIQRDFVTAPLVALYGFVICSMLFVGLVNPGLYNGKEERPLGDLPLRSHKNFQYDQPVLRFDHYCRWVSNCIGLRNHREFLLMLIGFMAIAVVGAVLDVVLLVNILSDFAKSEDMPDVEFYVLVIQLSLHLLYSFGFAYLVRPILTLHLGFVSRNELGYDWKFDRYYSVPSRLTGELIWVQDLDEEEFDERFDDFVYDGSRNPFDKGTCSANCWAFWCTPRWSRDQLGEF